MTNYTWTKGQQAVINRSRIVTIDKVTSAGRVRVGDETFDVDGRQKGGDGWRANKLEPLTPEIKNEMTLRVKGIKVYIKLDNTLRSVGVWAKDTIYGGSFGKIIVPTPSDIYRAKRLIAAIEAILQECQTP